MNKFANTFCALPEGSLVPVLTLAALITTQSNLAQTPGSLDPNFSSDGKVMIDLSAGNDRSYAIHRNSVNERVYLVGYNVSEVSPGVEGGRIVEVLSSGDISFNSNNGELNLPLNSYSRIYGTTDRTPSFVLTGQTGPSSEEHSMLLAGCYGDGVLHPNFGGGDGIVTTEFIPGQNSRGWDVAEIDWLNGDGFIAVGWSMNGGTPNEETFAVARHNVFGGLTSSFNGDGKLLIDFGPGSEWAHSVAVAEDDKLLVAGTYNGPTDSWFAIARLNPDGTFDNSFGTLGKRLVQMPSQSTLSDCWDVIIDSQERIVLVGFAGGNFNSTLPVIARLTPDGDIDQSFGIGGVIVLEAPGFNGGGFYSVVEQPDGKYACAGFLKVTSTDSDFLLALVNANGAFDDQFGSSGYVTTSFGIGDERARDIVFQEIGIWGSLLTVGGYAQETANDPIAFAVARYITLLNVGVVEFDRSASSLLVYPNPIEESTTLTYTLKDREQLTISLMDLQGRPVCTFLNAQEMAPGEHKQEITMPVDVASGNYLLVLSGPKGKMSVQVSKAN